MKGNILHIVLFLLPGLPLQVSAQYIANGSAFFTPANKNAFTLTKFTAGQTGSVWNSRPIDLTQSFRMNFDVSLGIASCINGSLGGSGIAFVLQNTGTTILGGGGNNGMGCAGITPSFMVTVDTYQNTAEGDPVSDHIAFQKNGNVNHNSGDNIAGPVAALPVNNIRCSGHSDSSVEVSQNGAFHKLTLEWDAAQKKMTAWFDDHLRLSANIDLAADLFGNNPMVYWGFTSSTNGVAGQPGIDAHSFFINKDPSFLIKELSPQRFCPNIPVQFQNTSTAFDEKFTSFWDFGDGTKDTATNPVHTYTAPGNYLATLYIKCADSVSSTVTAKTTVTINAVPQANFTVTNACAGKATQFSDSSYTSFGTINRWIWRFDNGHTDTIQNPVYIFSDTLDHTVSLTVFVKDGCDSATITKTIRAQAKPAVTATVADGCINDAIQFTGAALPAGVPVTVWEWKISDGSKNTNAVFTKQFSAAGTYNAVLLAKSGNGCYADTAKVNFTINATHAFAGNDTVVVLNEPLQLHANGGQLYEWIPATYLDSPFSSTPICTPRSDISYTLKAYSPTGCSSYNSISIKVYKGPEIYVPSAFTPNNDRLNDRLRAAVVGYHFEKLLIYNRYGQEIYSSTTTAAGWDGTYKGQAVTAGIYIYLVKVKDKNGLPVQKKGSFVLLR